jgi:hypothetical protein
LSFFVASFNWAIFSVLTAKYWIIWINSNSVYNLQERFTERSETTAKYATTSSEVWLYRRIQERNKDVPSRYTQQSVY